MQRPAWPGQQVGRLPPALERPALPKSVARCAVGRVSAMDIICFVNTEHILQNHGERKPRLDSGLETYTLHHQTVPTIFFNPPFPPTPLIRDLAGSTRDVGCGVVGAGAARARPGRDPGGAFSLLLFVPVDHVFLRITYGTVLLRVFSELCVKSSRDTRISKLAATGERLPASYSMLFDDTPPHTA